MAEQKNRFDVVMQRLEMLPPFLRLEWGIQRVAEHIAPLIVWAASFRERRRERAKAAPRPSHRWVKNQRHTSGRLTVTVFLFYLTIMTVLSFYLPLRPTESVLEQRTLTAFPKATVSTVLNGEYFSGINTWFADTFPFREGFVKFQSELEELYGFRSKKISGEVTRGDEIPDAPDAPIVDPADSSMPAAVPVEDEPDSSAAIEAADSEKNTNDDDDSSAAYETLGALLVRDDAAYEYYNFVKADADKYAATVNRTASRLKGKAQVYNLIIPTSMDICVPEKVRKGLDTSDQQAAIQYLYSCMTDQVKTVDIFETMQKYQEADEYLYFRTDHHWTALGAYRAYEQFTAAAGVKTADLEKDFTEDSYTGFTGSFYRDTTSSTLAAKPDIIYTYEPKSVDSCTITWADGHTSDYPIITDVSNWTNTQKYSTFIGSDNPLTVIENPNITDGSSVLLIKESFGNCFAPFLAESYQTVYVVDYRYFNQVDNRSLTQLVEDEGIQTVLFLNNISATRGETVDQLNSFAQ